MGRLRQETAVWESKIKHDLFTNNVSVVSGMEDLNSFIDLSHSSPDPPATPLGFEDSPTLGPIRGKAILELDDIEALHREVPKPIMAQGSTLPDDLFQPDLMDTPISGFEDSTPENISKNTTLLASASLFAQPRFLIGKYSQNKMVRYLSISTLAC